MAVIKVHSSDWLVRREILNSLKFLRVKIFEDITNFCLASNFLISKILVFQGCLLIFFQTQYVCVANILSVHNFVDLQNHENFTTKISF